MRPFIDITRPITANLISWPGRLPPEHTWEKRLADGDHCNASSWKMSAHSGTHMDAPLHFVAGGSSIDLVPPDVFVGVCTVVDLTSTDNQVLEAVLAGQHLGVERLLVKTDHSEATDPHYYPSHENLLTPEAGSILVDGGLKLLGTDRLSIDDSRGDDYALHRLLLKAGCVILEGLDLSKAMPGKYSLMAAPLRLAGKEASPVRALLFDL